MDREFLDERLHRLATELAYRPSGWNAQEVDDFRFFMHCAKAARFDSDLRNSKMLRITSDVDDVTRAQATLSSGRVLDLMFKNSGNHSTVVLDLLQDETDTK